MRVKKVLSQLFHRNFWQGVNRILKHVNSLPSLAPTIRTTRNNKIIWRINVDKKLQIEGFVKVVIIRLRLTEGITKEYYPPR